MDNYTDISGNIIPATTIKVLVPSSVVFGASDEGWVVSSTITDGDEDASEISRSQCLPQITLCFKPKSRGTLHVQNGKDRSIMVIFKMDRFSTVEENFQKVNVTELFS